MPGSRWDAPIAPRVQVQRAPVQVTSSVPMSSVPASSVPASRAPVVREPEPSRGVEVRGTETRATAQAAPISAPPPIEASLYRAPAEVPAKVPGPWSAEPATGMSEAPRSSVFDEDFFRSTRSGDRAEATDQRTGERMGDRGGERKGERAWEALDLSGVRNVQSEVPRSDVFHVQATAVADSARTPVAGADSGAGDPDELDIPAFLRRGH